MGPSCLFNLQLCFLSACRCPCPADRASAGLLLGILLSQVSCCPAEPQTLSRTCLGNICIVVFPFESKGVKDVVEELRKVTKRFLYFSLSWPSLVIWPPAGMPNNSSSSAYIFSHLFTKKEALSLIVRQP